MKSKIILLLAILSISLHIQGQEGIFKGANSPEFWREIIEYGQKNNKNIKKFNLSKGIDLTVNDNGTVSVFIVPGFLKTNKTSDKYDMIEDAWLCYAYNKAPQKIKNKSALQAEYDALIALLQSIDRSILKHREPPREQSIIQLSRWRKNNDLKTAIMLLMYRPVYEENLKEYLKNNPDGVLKFFEKYELIPDFEKNNLREASGTELFNGRIVSAIRVRLSKIHDEFPNKEDKFSEIVAKQNLIHNHTVDPGKYVPATVEIWTIKSRGGSLFSYLINVYDALSENSMIQIVDIDGLPISKAP